jgi:hypothetical protein
MFKMRHRRLAVIALFLLAGCFAPHDHVAANAPLVEDAKACAILESRCSACHPTNLIFSSVGTPSEWSAVVHRMVYHHKAKLLTHITDEEAAEITRWLAESQKPTISGVRIGYRPTERPL